MGKYYKLEITTTILVEADDRQEANSRLNNMSLAEIAEEMDSGDMLGQDVRGDLVEVPKAEMEAEQIALGGDGTFFQVNDDDEDEEDEGTYR